MLETFEVKRSGPRTRDCVFFQNLLFFPKRWSILGDMRKSSEVPISLLALLALSSMACNDAPVTRNCVDAQGHIIPDANCEYHSTGTHYVYGGSSGGRVGDKVVGGSDSEEGVSRGGFGHGEGEGGEGGGHGGGEGGGE